MQLPAMNRWTKRLLLYVATGALFVVAVMFLWNFYAVRIKAKWLLYSHHFKTEVLAQSGSKAGDFKHIEWDGWGWAGSDTTVYLVFDPSDSLSAAARKQRPGQVQRPTVRGRSSVRIGTQLVQRSVLHERVLGTAQCARLQRHRELVSINRVATTYRTT
jgi:hypothetical protein